MNIKLNDHNYISDDIAVLAMLVEDYNSGQMANIQAVHDTCLAYGIDLT